MLIFKEAALKSLIFREEKGKSRECLEIMPAYLLYLALIEENSLFEDEFEFLRVKEWSIEDFLVS